MSTVAHKLASYLGSLTSIVFRYLPIGPILSFKPPLLAEAYHQVSRCLPLCLADDDLRCLSEECRHVYLSLNSGFITTSILGINKILGLLALFAPAISPLYYKTLLRKTPFRKHKNSGKLDGKDDCFRADESSKSFCSNLMSSTSSYPWIDDESTVAISELSSLGRKYSSAPRSMRTTSASSSSSDMFISSQDQTESLNSMAEQTKNLETEIAAGEGVHILSARILY